MRERDHRESKAGQLRRDGGGPTPSWLIENADVCLPDRVLSRGAVLVSGGRIAGIFEDGDPLPATDERLDAEGLFLVPGFIDVHVHGGAGTDVMDAAEDGEAIGRIARFHASRGTTSFLPTTVSADRETLLAVIDGIVRAMDGPVGDGAEPLGFHLEGPFLNPARAGAQHPGAIRELAEEELAELLARAGGHMRLITLAPECGGALGLIRVLREHGVTVSLGHTDADYDTARRAAEAGASHVTHLFNGMRPLHHREPGVAGFALADGRMAVELICDGIHVHPEMVRLVFAAKPPESVVLITDAIEAAGMPDGEYSLGGLPVAVRDGKAILRDGGQLAGSCLTMDRALRNAMAFTGRSLFDILPALTINPARQIGVAHRKGTIETGKDADLVLLDRDFSVIRTFVRGACVYARE